MKKLFAKMKFIGTFLVIAAMCLPAMNVRAAETDDAAAPPKKTYTVTFRPGNVGYFAMEAVANVEGQEKELAGAVAALEYNAYQYTVTEHGAIKVTVPANAAVPAAPTYIQSDSGYFVKESSIWGPAGQDIKTVDKNMDFVVDYGKLVDGVEYTVKYVDSSSGESIAPVYITQANIGESRTVTAPSQIVISEGTVYNLTSAASLTLELDADSGKNVFTFSYTLAPSGTVVEEIVDYVDGGTVTTTETVTTYVNNGTTVTTTPAGQGGQGGGQGGGAVADNANENNGGNVTIEEENTPLAPSMENTQDQEGTGNAVTIGEDEVPLADFQPEGNSYAAMIWAGVFVAAAVAVTAFWLLTKKKSQVSDSSNTEQQE